MLTTINETWNGVRTWELSYRYFRLLSAPAAVTIKFGRGRSLLDEISNIDAGVAFRAKEGDPDFGLLQIVNPTNQAVKFVVGDGETQYDRAFGDVDVEDRADRVLGVVSGSLGTLVQSSVDSVNALEVVAAGSLGRLVQAAIGGLRALYTTERGFECGASVASNAAPAANTAVTLIAAASNVNGMTVWRSSFTLKNSATAWYAALLAKSSAPTSTVDGDVICGSDSVACDLTNNAIAIAGRLEHPVYVPAGKGLYLITGGNADAGYSAALYTLH